MTNSQSLIPVERIEHLILVIRGQEVMLSHDLASLYDVEPRTLLKAAKRNKERFPEDFMFQLTWEEVDLLASRLVAPDAIPSKVSRSQFAILKHGGNTKYRPYAFTEQGVAMLSSVLRSPRAVAVNIEIMRAFVRLRQMLLSHADLAKKVDALDKEVRQPVQGRFRRPAAVNAAAGGEAETADRISCKTVNQIRRVERRGGRRRLSEKRYPFVTLSADNLLCPLLLSQTRRLNTEH